MKEFEQLRELNYSFRQISIILFRHELFDHNIWNSLVKSLNGLANLKSVMITVPDQEHIILRPKYILHKFSWTFRLKRHIKVQILKNVSER